MKDNINIPDLRQLARKILAPLQTGSTDYLILKNELINRLRNNYDEIVGRLNEGAKAINTYEIRLRREAGQQQAEALTQPDKDALFHKRNEIQTIYDNLFSKIMLATNLDELAEIKKDFPDGWK